MWNGGLPVPFWMEPSFSWRPHPCPQLLQDSPKPLRSWLQLHNGFTLEEQRLLTRLPTAPPADRPLWQEQHFSYLPGILAPSPLMGGAWEKGDKSAVRPKGEGREGPFQPAGEEDELFALQGC